MKIRPLSLLTVFPRTMLIVIEVATAFAFIMVGVLLLLFAQISRGPVDLDFARDYIEGALSSAGHNASITFASAQLEWTAFNGPLQLNLRDLEIDENGQPVFVAQNLSLALAKAPLLIGQIRPERLILQNPVLTFERDETRGLHFALSENAGTTPPGKITNAPDITTALMGILTGDQKHDYGVLAKAKEIEIHSARVRIADYTAGMTWQLNDIDLSFHQVEEGILGSLQIALPNDEEFSATMTYNREHDALSVQSAFKDFSFPSFAGRLLGIDVMRHQRLPLTGSFMLEAALNTRRIEKFNLDATAAQGDLELTGVTDQTVGVKNAAVNVSYDAVARAWDVTHFDFTLGDIAVTSSAQLTRDDRGNYIGDYTVRVPEIALADLPEFWPESERDTAPGKWLLQKLSGATVSDLDITVPVHVLQKERQFTMLAMRPTATFAYKNLHVDYRPPLTPVSAAHGTGAYQDDVLMIKVAGGKIDDLSLNASTVTIHDLTKKGAGHAVLDLNFGGPLATVLKYISLDPINLGHKLPVKPDVVRGAGTYHALVSFPTIHDLPADQIDVDVDATLREIGLPGLVKGQTLGGGPYDLTVADGAFGLKGTGTLAGRPITLDFHEKLKPAAGDIEMTATAHVNSDAVMRKKFGANLPFLQGDVIGDVVYTAYANGHETVDIKADLTPTHIAFDTFVYDKLPGKSASASLFLNVKKGVPVSADKLNLTAPKFTIANGKLGFGMVDGEIDVTHADLPSFKLGQSNAGVTYRRSRDALDMTVTGKQFDLVPFVSGPDKNEPGPQTRVTVKTDELWFGGVDPVRGANLMAVIDPVTGPSRVQMTGTAGSAPMSLQYVPDKSGQLTLDLIAGDAGGFLRALGIYDNVRGGTLTVKGSPIGTNKRDVKGDLMIKDFSVIDAPVLAQLLGVLSLGGISEQLRNEGLVFTRLQSGFAWIRRGPQDIMSFSEGRTAGSALGLTFDGIYDRRKRNISIKGTIIPVAGLNTFAGRIPLLGRLLTGGNGGGLFAATYSIKGPSDAPTTMINPLSVLTPGILRKIFFEGSSDDPTKALRPKGGYNN